jgi:pyruvate dehydrogenase E1 component alpha subunit
MTAAAPVSTVDLPGRQALATDPLTRLGRMLQIRMLEDRILELFAEGLVHGSTHTCQGQEAVAVGLAAAARPTDWVSCTYRGHGVALALGATPVAGLGEVLGRSCGSARGLGGSMHLCEPEVGLLPTSAIVGAGIPIAVGAALSAAVRGTDQAAIAVFGDGTTNIGAFHEALNLASVWRLPVVFVCENNLYGEYSRIETTTPVTDLVDRAAAYAMPAVVVDGQDVTAVADAVGHALQRARAGDGPMLLEMKTYRYAGHSRGDAGAYRPDGELRSWQRRDPIELFQAALLAGVVDRSPGDRIDAAAIDGVRAVAAERIATAERTVLASPAPDRADMWANVTAGSPRSAVHR